MSGGSLEFDVDWNREGQSYLMLWLMQNRNAQENPALGGFLVAPDRRMLYLVFNEDSVMAYVLEGAGRAVEGGQTIQTSDPIHVRIRQVANNVALFINDREQGALRVSDEHAGETTVMFQTQTLRDGNRQRGGDLNMTVSDLRAGRGDGLIFHLPIPKAAREHVITVPRMRRDRPPLHVLVGRNGDLLRGKLLSLGSSSAQFESRLNNVVIPRDQLSGIVWLSGPAGSADEEAAPDAVEQPPRPQRNEPARPDGFVQATFGNGVVLTFAPEGVEGDELLTRHPVFGECRFTLATVTELRVGNAEDQTGQAERQPAFTEWTLIRAPEPVIPGANGGFGMWTQ